MTKQEIKKATNGQIICDYVKSYMFLCVNFNTGHGTKQLEKHCADLEAELIARNILTAEEVKRLNS